MQKRISSNQYFLTIARAVSMRSTCIDKQVGCVLTNQDNEILSTGYNGAPHGVSHCIDNGFCKKDRGGVCPSTHAEVNAILQCKDIPGIFNVYLTLSPCINCLRILLNTNAEYIYFLNEHRHHEPRLLWRAHHEQQTWNKEELQYDIRRTFQED